MARITSSTLLISVAMTARPCTSVEVICTLETIRLIAVTVSSTCARPAMAAVLDCEVTSDADAALLATSSTAALISLTAVAAISISLVWRRMVREASSVTACISSEVAASWVEESPIRIRALRRLACMVANAAISFAASSVPCCGMSWLRSLVAMRCAILNESPIGPVRLRVYIQARSSVVMTPTVMKMPTIHSVC